LKAKLSRKCNELELSSSWVLHGLILQFGRPPHRIDLMNQIDAVAFRKAWPSRTRVRLKTGIGLIPVLCIDLRSLLANKQATGRPKELTD